MQYRVPLTIVLVITGVLVAGCTQSQGTAATPAPAPAPAATTAAAARAALQPLFSLGSAYLDKPNGYTFNSEKDVITEKFRVDNSSWGIHLKIKPLNDDLQYCWFKMVVTNEDNGQSDTYGYGRDQSIETDQWIPMYTQGPYNTTMTGNRVKVWITAAKRNP
jgi:hypothetical protein